MIEFLKKTVLSASKLITDDFKVDKKGDDYDLITNLDLEVEKYIINTIKNEYPDYDIVSEEFNSSKNISNNCFTIDPIDGTINFANSIPLWGIQVACIKNGNPVAAVIYLPKFNELYYADEKGAYLNNKEIKIKEVPIKNAIYVIEGNHSEEKNIKIIKKMYKNAKNQRILGSMCVSFSYMAKGIINGVVFDADRPWDYMPGIYICEKAGAKIKNNKDFHAAAMNEEFLNILEEACK